MLVAVFVIPVQLLQSLQVPISNAKSRGHVSAKAQRHIAWSVVFTILLVDTYVEN